MAEEAGRIGAGPEKLVLIKLVAIGPSVTAVGRKRFEREIVLPCLA
jgi:hypothetical protein